MANSLSASFATKLSKEMQLQHFKRDVFRAITSFSEEDTLRSGQTVGRPYRSTLYTQTYTRGTAVTVQDITDISEPLTVDVAKVVPFYVDDLDAIQSNYSTLKLYAKDAVVALGNWLDGDVLGEYDQANQVVDDSEFGGTSGNGITLSTSNIQSIFSAAARKLDENNVDQNDRFAAISPRMYQTLIDLLAGRESQLGDKTGLNGNVGNYYGFDLYKSNATGWSGRLEVGTNPTANDTVVVKGVTFTFVASPSAAGDIDIGADAAGSVDNLVAAINAGAGAGTAYIEVSAANRNKLKGITATDGTTYMTLKAEGHGYVVVSETLTATADIWTTTKQIQHNLFGRKGAIDMVIQKQPNIEIKDVSDKLGKNVIPWTLYGLKTFLYGTKELVDAKTNSSSWS